MKLSIDGIKDKTAWEEAGIKLPAYDVRKVAENTKASPEWVHFGIGNIFRIFIGGIADSLIEQGVSDKGITCVETFDFDVVDKIYEPFDNLVMAVTLKEDGSTDKRVLGSLTEAVKAQSASKEAWSRLKEIFANPQLEMISFTITEKGYALRDAKGAFFPFIQSDIDNGPDKAVSAMAVVAALLFERFNTCKAPLAVVSMDNCSHNGEKLRNSITEMVREWQKKGYVGQDFADYVNDENVISFPWSMIDKITPRPADSVAAALEQAGVEQMKPVITSKKTYIAPFVNAEGPQYLVIEDRFPNGRPQLEKAGVYMTDRETVNKVERMKVTTCLNPLHTALAVYGCILGYNLIADEMKDKELSELVRRIGLVEGMPVVTDPGIISPEKFAGIEKLFASNPVKKERFESYNGKIPPAVKGWFLTCDEEQKLLFEEQFKALGEYFTEKQFNRYAVKTGLRTHMKNSAKGAKYQLKIFGYSWVVDQNKNILWFNPVIEKIS